MLGSQTLRALMLVTHGSLYLCVFQAFGVMNEDAYNLSGETFQGTVNVSSCSLRVG